MTISSDGTAKEALDPASEMGDCTVRDIPVSAPDISLEMLMDRYQQGDPDAATALIHQLSPRLYRFFMVQLASRRDAEDLLQETWLRIHGARHTYRVGQPVLPWFFSIARHIRVDHYRKVCRAARRETQIAEMAELPAPPLRSELPDTFDLEMLLAPLPESQREVVEMLKVAGMSLEDVARATSSTVGSVKQKAHRAYEKIRRHLGSVSPDGLKGGL
jgi:RNA polymerase sigma-70 factor (ECF subfamily)